MKKAPHSTCLRICLALGLIFGSWGCALHHGDLIPGWINGQTFEYHPLTVRDRLRRVARAGARGMLREAALRSVRRARLRKPATIAQGVFPPGRRPHAEHRTILSGICRLITPRDRLQRLARVGRWVEVQYTLAGSSACRQCGMCSSGTTSGLQASAEGV